MTRLATFATVTAAMLLCLGLFAGCSESSTSPLAGLSGTPDESSSAAAADVDQNTDALRALGVVDGSDKGVFSLGWREIMEPGSRSALTVGDAMAVAFDGDTAATGRRRATVDIGSVYLNAAGNRIELKKHTGMKGEVNYSTRGNRKNAPPTNVAFVGGGAYEFEVTGSAKFSALKTSVTAPSALLSISNSADGDSINSANDLQLNWSGGSASGGVVLMVVPLRGKPGGGMDHPGNGGGGRGQGPGGGTGGGMMPPGGGQGGGMMPPGGPNGGQHGPGGQPNGPGGPGGMMPPPPDSGRGIVVKLETNPGAYTISAAQIQELIQKTSAKGIACIVSQVTKTDVAHDGGTVHVVLHNGDQVHLRIY